MGDVKDMDDIREQLKHDARDDWPDLHCALCRKLFIEDERPISTFKVGSIGHIDCILTMDWPEQINEARRPSERPHARPVPWGRPFPETLSDDD